MSQRHLASSLLYEPTLVAIAVTCLMGGCASFGNLTDYSRLQKRHDTLALSTEENADIVEDLARKVEGAYGEAECLSFHAECTWPRDVRLQANVAMAPGRLKTVGFVEGTRVMVCTLQNGLFEEYKAAFKGIPTMYQLQHVADASGPYDLELMEGIEEYGCPMGGFYHTWLGPGASKPVFFAERIRAGDYLGKAFFEGQRCDLVLCQPTARYGGTELFYVRADGLVVRWDTFLTNDGDPGPTHQRSRIYHGMSTVRLPEETWHFESLKQEDFEATRTTYRAIDESVQRESWEEALRALDTVLNKRPQDLGLLKKRFEVLAVGMKDHDAAISCAGRLFENVSHAPGFLNDFAWSLLTDGRYAGRYAALALEFSEESNRLTDYASWPFLDTLARASFETGDVERAISLQEKAIELCSWDMPQLDEALARYKAAD